MAGPTEPRETEVINAIADTLVARTNLLVTTRIRGGVSAGALTVPVASLTGFNVGGYVHWFDNSGEPMLAIGGLDPAGPVIDIDFAGYAEQGLTEVLQHDHADGALIATNLMLHRPMGIASMLRSGAPVVAIWPLRKKTREFSVSSTISPLVVRIQVHVALQQFAAAPMDPEAYNQLRQEANWANMNVVLNALDQNRHLLANYNSPGAHANGLGDGNAGFAVTEWVILTEKDGVDITQAIAAMDVTVRPLRYNRREPT